MILLYLTSANSEGALLTITHKNRALLKMASVDRFEEIVEEQIPQIIPINTKRQTTGSPKFVDFGNARFENCNFAFTYNVSKKVIDLL